MRLSVMKWRPFVIILLIAVVAVVTVAIVSENNSNDTNVNYGDMNNWMFYPQEHQHNVDVIYIYPTVFCSNDNLDNSPINDPVMRQQAQDVYKHQGSVFETVGDVYVPYYRQFTGQFLMKSDSMEGLLDTTKIAYADVANALDYYFENNPDRPFILAGHSQGTIMQELVLTIYMKQHPEYYERMVAAYLLGYAVPLSVMQANPHLKAATCADDVGVIVSWNTETPGDPSATGMFKLGPQLCINPLNWKTDDTYAAITENKGSFLLLDDGTYGIGNGVVDAYINTSYYVLNVSNDSPDTAAKTLSPGDIEMIKTLGGEYTKHMDDYDYFYQNIRENAQLRVDKYFETL